MRLNKIEQKIPENEICYRALLQCFDNLKKLGKGETLASFQEEGDNQVTVTS